MPKLRVKRRTAWAQPDKQQRAIDVLVSELGHAINNPLFAARAGVSLVAADGCSEETAAQLRAIEYELARIAIAMRELRARVEQSLAAVSQRTKLRHTQVDDQRNRTADKRR